MNDASASSKCIKKAGAVDPCTVTLVLLGLLLIRSGLTVLRSTGTTGPAEASATAKVDPNLAPWWELTVLPRIGEGLARAIVEFRESAASKLYNQSRARVFDSAVDLTAVPGIGPRTLLRIGPYLQFGAQRGD